MNIIALLSHGIQAKMVQYKKRLCFDKAWVSFGLTVHLATVLRVDVE
jgi:hypothetical protein